MTPRSNGSAKADTVLYSSSDSWVLLTATPSPRIIQQRSDDLLQVGQGSLYPSLHRLEDRKWIASFWGTSENNRRARYYRLTPAGRKQLVAETTRWEQLVRAVSRVLRPIEDPQ